MPSFELGPIRPPSEAESILIRFTRNCPWNKCVFCHSYKDEKFSLRPVQEIKNDIDAVADAVASFSEKLSGTTQLTRPELLNAVRSVSSENNMPIQQADTAAYWFLTGMKSVFIQDADSLVMKSDDIAELLIHIKKRFPAVKSITTYARARTVAKKSLEDLIKFRECGLTRLNIGMESGSEKVLKLINKGVTPEEQITAGLNAIKAGLELSEYFMPGVGGIDLIEENAIETANVINQINPNYVRIRSVVPLPGTKLFEMQQNGSWKNPSEDQKAEEIKLFLARLEGIQSVIESGHIMNLIEDIDGKLPEDKNRLLSVVDEYLNSPTDVKESFIIARRLGLARYFSGFRTNSEIESAKRELINKFGSVEKSIAGILQNYI